MSGSPEPKAALRPLASAAPVAAVLLLAAACFAADPSTDPASNLSKIVGRLSAQEKCSGAGLVRARPRNRQLGPEPGVRSPNRARGPVRDALAAVDLGAASIRRPRTGTLAAGP